MNGGEFQPFMATPDVTFTLPGVEWLKNYKIRVRAVTQAGVRGPFSEVSEIYDSGEPVGAPPVPPGG